MIPYLSAVHLNDNGINSFGQQSNIHGEESEIKLELLDVFGIDNSADNSKEEYRVNRYLKFHDVIEQRIRDQITSMYDPKNFIN